jgi:hypothetical protein
MIDDIGPGGARHPRGGSRLPSWRPWLARSRAIAQKAAEDRRAGAVVAARGHEMATDLRRADDADHASESAEAAGPSTQAGADEADGA